MKQGDVITTLNGQKIANSSALQVAVSELAPGTSISLGVLREGKPTTVSITIGTFNNDRQELADNENGGPQSGKLGLAVADLTQDARQELQVPENVKGAVVENVRPASPADDAGLQPGDVILEVNRKPTASADQFVSQVHGDNGGDLLLLVWSKGNASYRTVHPDSGQNG